MRFIEVTGGLNMPVSEEEQQLIEKVGKTNNINKKKLTEREQELARKLVSRGILDRKQIDKEYHFSVNLLELVERN